MQARKMLGASCTGCVTRSTLTALLLSFGRAVVAIAPTQTPEWDEDQQSAAESRCCRSVGNAITRAAPTKCPPLVQPDSVNVAMQAMCGNDYRAATSSSASSVLNVPTRPSL